MVSRETRHKCSKLQARGRIAIAGGILCIALAWWPAVAHAVSEESIGASPRHQNSEETVPPVPAEAAPEAAPTEAAPESAPTVEQPSAEANPSNTENPSSPTRALQPHATFPYTIRPGDNLGALASEFGVTVDDLSRVNHMSEDTELIVGESLRIPNPGLARERDLTKQVNQLVLDQQAAEERARRSETELRQRRSEVDDLTTQLRQVEHDARMLAWWRGSAFTLGVLATVMFAAMALALLEWWVLRNRFRAVAELNDSLRRLDYKYKSALAKAELRLQELYGRRRRGVRDGQERSKIAEEGEIERLNQELKAVLEHHLARLGPAWAFAGRVRWEERVSGIGSPVEARPLRRWPRSTS